MTKTKLGISTNLLAAITFLIGLFGNTVALVIAAGYVLIREDDGWLRKSAIKALVIHLVFLAVSVVIAFIPNVLGALDSFLNIFRSGFSYPFVTNVKVFLSSAVEIIRILLFFIMALLALRGQSLPVPGLDGAIEKHS